MTWRPISESGVPFEFNDTFGTVSIAGSTVTAPLNSGPAWNIVIGDGSTDYNIRVTVQSYDSQVVFLDDPSAFRFELAGGGDTTVTNENTGTTTEFSPNPVLGVGRIVDYIPGSGVETSRDEAYSMLVELDVVTTPAVRPILQTFRGYRGADSAFRTWIRTDEGRADLSAATVTVRIYAYDSRTMLVELPATADALGMVDFTLPQATANRQLPGSLFRLELVMAVDGGVQLAQLGILELLG